MYDSTNLSQLEAIQQTLRRRANELAAKSPELPAPPEDQWGRFFATYNPILRGFARSVDCPDDLIDDVVSNVWMYVLIKLPDFCYDQNRSGFRAWLYRVVRSKAIDEVRKRSTLRKHVVGQPKSDIWNDLSNPGESSLDDPLEAMFCEHVRQVVWEEYVRQARPEECEVIKRYLMEDRPAADVARELGLTESHVRKLKQRGVLRLQTIRAELFGPSSAE